MAIDISTTTSLTDALKLAYGDGMRKQFAEEVTLWNRLPRAPESDSPVGLGFEFMVRYANPQGIGFRGEDDKLPDPLAGKQDKARVNAKHVYGAVRLTGAVIDAGKNDKGAFVKTLELEMDGAYSQVMEVLNRVAHGDGYGKLATLSAASDALDETATNTWNVTCNNDLGVRYLREGMLVDFYDGAAIDQSSVASRIKYVDISNKIAVMEGNDGTYKANHPRSGFSSYTIVAEAVPSGATMVAMGTRDDSHATTDTSYEMTGLLGIFDDSTLITTFQNINASTNYFWRANILGNSGTNREVTEDLLIKAAQTHRAACGKNPNVAYMGQGQQRKLANIFLPDVRFQPQELKGGWMVMTFAVNGTPIEFVVDPYAQPNAIFLTNDGAIEKFILKDLDWIERMHMREGYDQWTSYLALRGNIGVRNRKACTYLKDLVEPS